MPKKKVKWSFIVASDAENMMQLDDAFFSGEGWEIPNDAVIGILKLEEPRDEK